MAKQSNQKAKLLYLQKILMAETDAEHGITIAGMAEKLAELGIAAERKSLYDDIEVLRSTGMEIATERGRSNIYKLVGRVPDAAAVLKTGRALKAAGADDADAVVDALCALLSKYETEAVKAALVAGADEAPAAAQKPEPFAQDAAAEAQTVEATEIVPQADAEIVTADTKLEAAPQETGVAEEKSAAEAEKTAAEDGEAGKTDDEDTGAIYETIELKCSTDLQDAVLAYLGADARIVKTKSSGVVIEAQAVMNEDFYVQLIKWGAGVKLSEPSYRRKEFKKYCKKILSQYK